MPNKNNLLFAAALLVIGALLGYQLAHNEKQNSREKNVSVSLASTDSSQEEASKFLNEFNPSELTQLDAYYDNFRNSKLNLSTAYQLVEVFNSNIQRFESFRFKDKYYEYVRAGLIRSYSYLKEAYEAKLESINQIENPMAMASAVSKANAKQMMIALNILSTLLSYEKTHAIDDYTNAPDLQALIKKYRGICNFYGELKEE